jgi:hypothetical protein
MSKSGIRKSPQKGTELPANVLKMLRGLKPCHVLAHIDIESARLSECQLKCETPRSLLTLILEICHVSHTA